MIQSQKISDCWLHERLKESRQQVTHSFQMSDQSWITTIVRDSKSFKTLILIMMECPELKYLWSPIIAIYREEWTRTNGERTRATNVPFSSFSHDDDQKASDISFPRLLVKHALFVNPTTTPIKTYSTYNNFILLQYHEDRCYPIPSCRHCRCLCSSARSIPSIHIALCFRFRTWFPKTFGILVSLVNNRRDLHL